MGVWIPEIVDYFNSRLSLISVDSKPVTILFSRPDILARPEDVEKLLPEINFRYYDILPDKSRYESDILLRGNANSTNKTIETKPTPIPYNLFFEFTLTAKYMDDIVQMESKLTSFFPPRAVIKVFDPSISDTYDLDMWQRSYRIMDLEELPTPRYGQVPIRLFRRVFRYVIRCEQDIYPWTLVPMITDVKPTVTKYPELPL